MCDLTRRTQALIVVNNTDVILSELDQSGCYAGKTDKEQKQKLRNQTEDTERILMRALVGDPEDGSRGG